MNPRLVICVLLSTALTVGAAITTFTMGYGLFAAFMVWSVGGAVVLLVTSLVAVAIEDGLGAFKQRKLRKHQAVNA